MKDKCRVIVFSKGYHSEPSHCGKPAKGALKNGTPACGVHLAAERTREKNNEKRARKKQARTAAAVRAHALGEALGISVSSDWDRPQMASVSLADLERLVEEIAALKALTGGAK